VTPATRRGLALLLYSVAMLAAAGWLLRGTAERVSARIPDAAAPVAASDAPLALTEVTVEQGMGAAEISAALASSNVVDAARFELLAAYAGASASLQAGCYEIEAGTPVTEVLRRLRSGDTTGRVLAIPEGLRIEEVGERVTRASVATTEEWQSALRAALETSPPGGLPANVDLTGYLLPAAYPLECDTDAVSLLAAMRAAFQERVTPDLVAEALEQDLTLHEVLTIASIVEREAVVKEERPLVASVFRNRLEEGIALQADPTVQYAVATPSSVAQYGWWKRDLTLDDLALESPYNTYTEPGLPPGPIANPGLDAIIATIRPATTDYLYFVARGDGTHAFAETLAEHNANVERFITNGQ
jgi:UPF0755 protein